MSRGFQPPLSPDGYVYTAAEPLRAGAYVTPDASGQLRQAKPGDPMVGAMGMLEDADPGDRVAFERPHGGLGRVIRL